MPVIITERWPEGYNQDYKSYLYNQEAFIALQLDQKSIARSFYGIDTKTQRIVGKVHFFKNNNGKKTTYRSPLKSPFGSFEVHEHATKEEVEGFVQFVLNQLREEPPVTINIQHPAAIYHPENTSQIKMSLLTAGFSLKEEIPNHHITVEKASLEKKMHSMERRRLKKCQNAGFSFKKEHLSALTDVYDFVLKCRKERGWELSMSLAALQKVIAAFPENYKLFSVYKGDQRVAATIAVVVNSRILYNFYPASLLSYQSYSPTVMLMDGLYRYCQQKGIEILDLGTSTTNSLQLFKEHMGGEISYKYEFTYHSSR